MKKVRLGLGLAAASVVLAIVFHTRLLTALGSYLVESDPPRKADLALVLAGDSFGHRILTAAELEREGYVPRVLVSGPSGMYGFHECDLAIPFAVKAGYPESYFLHFENDSRSTAAEAMDALPVLERMGVHTVLVVTSNYHTRRAGNIYRGLGSPIQFVMVAAPDENFSPDGWWHSREGRKTLLYEWMKTAGEWLHL